METLEYKISCRKAKCKDFVYIGQTKRRFCDGFSEHRGYVSGKTLEQVCGAHFNQKGHTKTDMLPTILEKIYQKDNTFLILKRERLWIHYANSVST